MYGKIQITGTLVVLTGMHIGTSGAFAAIGAVDSPVVIDVRTKLPIIPGSSLKGKMRSLLAKCYNTEIAKKPDFDCERITRLFGSSERKQKSRILFTDMILSNADELRNHGAISLTEVKFENTINRLTAVANPRQIERVIRGSTFDLDLIYEVCGTGEEESKIQEEVLEDMETISMGLSLLEFDYLGGSGSRGYGQVRFSDVGVHNAIGDIPDDLVEKCKETFSDFC